MSPNPLTKSSAEKVSFGLSLFVIGLAIALVCYTWVTGDNNPPQLTVQTQSSRQSQNQYYVPFKVTNSGGKTAESVEVTAQLTSPTWSPELGRQEINFLSRQESREGEFIFSHDPEQGNLVIRVAGYKLP